MVHPILDSAGHVWATERTAICAVAPPPYVYLILVVQIYLDPTTWLLQFYDLLFSRHYLCT